jgi:deoxyribonuclease-4
MLIGIHTSISQGYAEAVRTGDDMGAEVVQIFVRANMNWSKKRILDYEIEEYREALMNAKSVRRVIAHCSYLINLASDNNTTVKRSISLMAEEIEICERLGIDTYVIHPGSHRGQGVEVGINKVVDGLMMVGERLKSASVAITFETTAGSGFQIGSRLEEIITLVKSTSHFIRNGICLDTAHLFGAGYDIVKEEVYESILKQIKTEFGLDIIRVVHMNDSKVKCGSNRDRHQHIGMGYIDLSLFKRILKDERLKMAVAVLETPKEKREEDNEDYDRINISLLKSLRDG